MNEETDNSKKLMRDKILEAIKSGHVSMRPRWHFMLKAGLVAVGGVILFLALLYLTSFIIFVLHQTGIWFVPLFGLRGIYVFLISFPWLLLLASLVFIIILEVLVRQYAFAYRRPLLYSLVGIAGVVVAGGAIVSWTPLHVKVFRYVEHNQFPVAAPLYKGFGNRHIPNVHPGTILIMKPDGFIMRNKRFDVVGVVITPKTRLPLGQDFRTGDFVVVFGEWNNGVIHAMGVRKIQE